MSRSLAERFADLTPAERVDILIQAELTDDEARALCTDWRFLRRPEQMVQMNGPSKVAFITGRGAGKTTSASNAYHERVSYLASLPRSARRRVPRGGIVHRTSADVRDICVEGPDGILQTAPPHARPKFEPSKRRLTWPNGFQATTFTAEQPDELRGPTLSLVWAEEVATWKGERGTDGATAWDNLSFCLRGDDPLLLMTTTPKRTRVMREIEADANVLIIRGSMYDNLRNLTPSYIDDIRSRYAGTALGIQEIMGILATDAPGAAFSSSHFEQFRVVEADLPSLQMPVIAVDPSVGDGSRDECGISIVALSAGPLPLDNKVHGYVLDDATVSGPPDRWAAEVAEVAAYWGTHTVVVEGNQGGQMARTILRNVAPALRVRTVHARVGKIVRAEPAAALFAQGLWHIVDELPELEDQCSTWAPGDPGSPDRMDAMVHGVNHLIPKMRGT